jgi:AcrR family transcriptional regulator
MDAALTFAPEMLDPALDTAKRRQILDGARAVFLAQGFEGSSMNDIARAAGVSKGTLYVYFENKERLFAAIVDEERYSHVNLIFDFDHADGDVEAVLMRVGTQLAAFLTQPRIISAMRVVMGIAERMPELGQRFYDTGPCLARSKLSAYFDRRVAAGQLDIPDTLLAAAQFLEMSHSPVAKPMFFGSREQPSAERIEEVVRSAVRVFMAAYGRKDGCGAAP